MSMKDWARKLDDFLKLNEREVLTDAGRVSHELAEEKAGRAFETYDASRRRLAAAENTDFDQAVEGIRKAVGRRSKKPTE